MLRGYFSNYNIFCEEDSRKFFKIQIKNKRNLNPGNLKQFFRGVF